MGLSLAELTIVQSPLGIKILILLFPRALWLYPLLKAGSHFPTEDQPLQEPTRNKTEKPQSADHVTKIVTSTTPYKALFSPGEVSVAIPSCLFFPKWNSLREDRTEVVPALSSDTALSHPHHPEDGTELLQGAFT